MHPRCGIITAAVVGFLLTSGLLGVCSAPGQHFEGEGGYGINLLRGCLWQKLYKVCEDKYWGIYNVLHFSNFVKVGMRDFATTAWSWFRSIEGPRETYLGTPVHAGHVLDHVRACRPSGEYLGPYQI